MAKKAKKGGNAQLEALAANAAQPMSADEKKQKIDDLLAKLTKEYPTTQLIRVEDAESRKDLQLEVFSTRIYQLDRALGCGGIPRGRIIEIYGMESTGKTTTFLYIAAAAEEYGLKVMYLDVEKTLEEKHVQNCGVREMLVVRPTIGDDVFNIIEKSIGVYDVFIVDSVSALLPADEEAKDTGSASMAGQARLMSQALRKLNGKIAMAKGNIIFSNQFRSKIGLVFGDPRVTSGGQALKFYASIRAEIAKQDKIEKDGKIIGFKSRIKTVKSKAGQALGEEQISIMFDSTTTIPRNLLDFAVTVGVLVKAGSWYTYDGKNVAQGYEGTLNKIIEDRDLFDKINNDCFEKRFDYQRSLEDIESTTSSEEEGFI